MSDIFQKAKGLRIPFWEGKNNIDWIKIVECRFDTTLAIRYHKYVESYDVVLESGEQAKHIVHRPRNMRFHFASHIDEFPLFFRDENLKPAYDLEELNEKLLYLVGNYIIYDIIPQYHYLFLLAKKAIDTYEGSRFDKQALAFALPVAYSKSFIDRLEPKKKEILASTYGEEYVVVDPTPYVYVTKNSDDEIVSCKPHIDLHKQVFVTLESSEDFCSNPLVWWVAARLNGFFEDEEINTVADFLIDRAKVNCKNFYWCGRTIGLFRNMPKPSHYKPASDFLLKLAAEMNDDGKSDAYAEFGLSYYTLVFGHPEVERYMQEEEQSKQQMTEVAKVDVSIIDELLSDDELLLLRRTMGHFLKDPDYATGEESGLSFDRLEFGSPLPLEIVLRDWNTSLEDGRGRRDFRNGDCYSLYVKLYEELKIYEESN